MSAAKSKGELMKKNTFLFLAGCSIIIAIIILVNISIKRDERQSLSSDSKNNAQKIEADDEQQVQELMFQEVEEELPLPEGEPLLN